MALLGRAAASRRIGAWLAEAPKPALTAPCPTFPYSVCTLQPNMHRSCGAGALARLLLLLLLSLSACRANPCANQEEVEQLADLLADQSLALQDCEQAKADLTTELLAHKQTTPGIPTCDADDSSRVSARIGRLGAFARPASLAAVGSSDSRLLPKPLPAPPLVQQLQDVRGELESAQEELAAIEEVLQVAQVGAACTSAVRCRVPWRARCSCLPFS